MLLGSLGLALLAAGSGPGCTTGEARPEERSCRITIWHRPASRAARVEIVGDFNSWARPGLLPERVGDEWRALSLELPPGEHGYLIVEDGVALTDRNVATTSFHEGEEVTFVDIPDCGKPAMRVDSVRVDASGKGTVEATFLAARGGARLDPSSLLLRARDGRAVRGEGDPSTGRAGFVLEGLPSGKTLFALEGRAQDGVRAEGAFATAWVEPRPFDPRDTILYQIVLDRFRGENGPLAPPPTPADRAGGTLGGARRALEEGVFERLGVNALWISPVYQNPEGKYPGSDGRSYSSYHGYWPTDPRAVDARLGGEGELSALISAAHSRGLRVLLDVVPNHVHQDHPYAKNTEYIDGSASCVCGAKGCDWATNIDTCWFAPYLPDLDWTHPDLARTATEDTVWWLERFEVDGFRIDAVPMTPRAATRRIANLARRRFAHPGNPLLVLGENFTGPGGYSLLRRDLGPFGLDGTFHFPLMWTLRESIAEERSGLGAVDLSMQASEKAWGGSGAVMGVMLGNHDVSRFASVSAGTTSGDTWEPAKDTKNPLIFSKQRLGFGAVMALPGMPVIYYGDEIALAGKSDPDCRRVMPDEATLSAEQRSLRDFVARLGKARSCSLPLRRGTYRGLYSDSERLVFAREGADGDRVVVILSRKPAGALDLALVNIPPGTYTDLLTGEALPVAAQGSLDLEAFSVRYLASNRACAAP